MTLDRAAHAAQSAMYIEALNAMAPSQLVWQLVKNYNCFLHKGLNGSQFSAEPGNLYNLNSYKYSGIANEKIVHVEAAEEGSFAVTRNIPKNSNKPRDSRSKATKKNKNFRRAAIRLGKEVHTVRPDLKKAALARASAVNKSQRTTAAKSS
ncbi:ribosomal protein L28e [Coccomyxa subellipsoidea C-169]|uniref:Ribosomal protein L28e n=1 Tax=Coccomyxa subellipsoidea (strain C-169) TaxID=574566 RepID=I0YPL7_COCSC|nr:ribosomal protein L28e [Coccomyxa subellipsoidea C-169]EIE20336.1 ribosomal protein L28e [Coccomyxa subellipsoidea C-169]|eukprot:XP_005644880.1 ribosomal protein L28e [Coccomyxa subellipsoidea C-169]